MLGQDFQSGVVYEAHDRWLEVKTRGPIISRGVVEPIVRLTAEDRDGNMHREMVLANRNYRIVGAFPSSAAVSLPPVCDTRSAPKVKSVRRRKVEAVPAHTRSARPRAASASPSVAKSLWPDEYAEEACYWLPADMSGIGSAQCAVINLLSGLPWVEAHAARWSSDGDIVEHDVPHGFEAVELARRIHGEPRPTLSQVHSVQRSLALLLARDIVEESPGNRLRYRLRGWQCLHTRRRITRRAIEHGGGRAVYATVRFSA